VGSSCWHGHLNAAGSLAAHVEMVAAELNSHSGVAAGDETFQSINVQLLSGRQAKISLPLCSTAWEAKRLAAEALGLPASGCFRLLLKGKPLEETHQLDGGCREPLTLVVVFTKQVWLRNLPFYTTVPDVLACFSLHDIAEHISNSPGSVQMVVRSGEWQAVIEMQSAEDAHIAQKLLAGQRMVATTGDAHTFLDAYLNYEDFCGEKRQDNQHVPR